MTRPADALAEARAQVDESLAILRAVGDRRTFGKVLWCLAGINADLGDAETAAAQFEESLTLFIEFGDRWFCVLVLEVGSLPCSVVPGRRASRPAPRRRRQRARETSAFHSCSAFESPTTGSWPNRAQPWGMVVS